MTKICTPRIFGAVLFAGIVFLGAFAAAQTAKNQTASSQLVQLQGKLEIQFQDFSNGHSRVLYALKQADGTRVPLQFTKNPPTHLLTGDSVTVSGQRSGNGLILYSGSTNVRKTGGGGSTGGTTTTSSIPLPNTFGAQSVLVILVNFQDDAVQPYTVSDAQSAFFGATNSANSFVQENSYGQTSLTGAVAGWFTIPDSVTTCNMSQIATDAQNAATAAGVNLANYTRYVYMFPYDSACGWAGSSYVGGNPSQSWINGTTGPGGTTLDMHTMVHELGHAFGLWHSHAMDCGTSATICSSPNIVEYGDPLDVMGRVQTVSPEYNAFQKERLGWLNYGSSPSIQTVTSSGSYTIYPLELGGSGPNALKILKSTDPTTGASTWYYLEGRQAIGFDSFLTDDSSYYTQNETTGVLFHLGTDGNGNTSNALDLTPATPTSGGWFDPSLVVGQSFQDSAAGVTFTPTVVSSTSATVQVTMGGSSCSAANPAVGVSPSQSQYVVSGTPVAFTVTVTDKDSSSCAPATFNLAGTLPSGWTGVLSAATLSLSPGASGSYTLTVTSPAGTADGSYNVVASATNASVPSYGGSATAAYVINSAPLTTTVTTNQSMYLPGQTVGIGVTMLYGTSPDVGAKVTVTVSNPNGKTTTLSGTTGSSGVAFLNYKLSKGAAAGNYPVQAQPATTVSGASATIGASTTFLVQ